MLDQPQSGPVSPTRSPVPLGDGADQPRGAGSAAPASPVVAPPAQPDTQAAPARIRNRSLPEGTQARGFALYVGIDDAKAAADGTSLAAIVEQLKALISTLAPAAETYAAVAVAAEGSGGRDVDVVRLALQDRSAAAAHREAEQPEPNEIGVVIDISRKRVILHGQAVAVTYTEFELLQFLVLREGRTVPRQEIIEGLWSDGEAEPPTERTIDVHVRRLRSKLGAFGEIVRTVRGAGYRFDRHADVTVRYSSTPSPDLL